MDPFQISFSIQGFDPRDPDFLENRYAYYRRFRESDPVMRTDVPGGIPTWYLYRHADVSAALKDRRLVLDYETVYPQRPSTQFPPRFVTLNGLLKNWLLFRDPPFHTRLRSQVNRVFTPDLVENLRARIRTVAAGLLDQIPDSGTVDLMPHYAWPLPVEVICELLGVEPAMRPRIREPARLLAGAIGGGITANMLSTAEQACAGLVHYFDGLVERRLRAPADDLVSILSTRLKEADSMSREELVSMCILLMFAGHETSVNLIGNGILALLRDPGELEKLKSDPDLIASAVEEFLRYDPPVQLVYRFAVEDLEFAGKVIPRGERVGVMLGAANHDPEQFTDPDRLDISRKPGRILSFGAGIHYCLGALLGRAEGEVAIGELVKRYPDIRLAPESPRWRPNVIFAGLASLPVNLR